MAENASISSRVLDTLVGAGLITVEQLASVRDAAGASTRSVGEILAERGLVTTADVSTALEEDMGVPHVDLGSYVPETDALALLPKRIAQSRRILPLFEIEGMLTVAIGDPWDVFRLDEVASDIGLEIEPVLADPASVLEAVTQYYGEPSSEPEPDVAQAVVEPSTTVSEELRLRPHEEPPPPPPIAEGLAAQPSPVEGLGTFGVEDLFEAPAASAEASTVDGRDEAAVRSAKIEVSEDAAETVRGEATTVTPATIEQVAEASSSEGGAGVDLDVLAVADPARIAVLVTDILSLAVRKGASLVELLPYKTDFFLVFRIAGVLEKIATAPLSMEAALVDGFKAYARLGGLAPTLPALGRLHARVADRDIVLTISVVPTIAGQRMVATIGAAQPVPPTLAALGMSEAEVRALQAMVERGRGMLLVGAPVQGGRSATYYALLSHAATVGRTAYSVERSVEYEIPAVAQVFVNPGSTVGAASYFAAGMRQDADVMAIDGLESVEDIHLAVEAAGMGKLVLATFTGGDIVSCVRRMLDMGAEPNSLAAALTLAVGQRLVRTNCPECALETRDALVAKIPGAPKGLVNMAGAGCDACGKTGFAGITGVFEVLPFTEPIRATVATGASLSELVSAAKATGMRPLVASGLAKVVEGRVSAAELERVLRFNE